MRILFAAGGTAGHINPAIAVAQHLRTRAPDTACLFAATPNGMEVKLVHDAGFETAELEIKGLVRSLSYESIRRIAMIPRAIHRASEIIRTFQPDIVFATGGYLSYPVVRATRHQGIPCILHESNAIAGFSMRVLAKHADAVLLNHMSAAETLPRGCRISHVGNPLRAEFHILSRAHARQTLGISDDTYMILSCGGSLGAARLNSVCAETARKMRCDIPSLVWHHVAGENKYEETKALTERLQISAIYHVHPYLSNMALYMAAADVVISRAGAVTLTELSALGKASILIPYPQAAKDHQTRNAEVFNDRKAAITYREENLNADCLSSTLSELWKNPHKRHLLERNIRTLYKPDACEEIRKILYDSL